MKLKYSLFALIALAVSGCQKAPVYDDVVYIAGAEGEVPTPVSYTHLTLPTT